MLGIQLDGLDHQVEFVGAVDLPRNAIILARCGRLGFAEVMEPIHTAYRVISHEQDGTGAITRVQISCLTAFRTLKTLGTARL